MNIILWAEALTKFKSHSFHNTIIREYDIRGVYNETLFDKDAEILGNLFGLEVGINKTVNVAYDGRLSSINLKERLIKGLVDSGVNVNEIGLVPTPLLYYSCFELVANGGIIVTGSHNPKEHNGFKIVTGGTDSHIVWLDLTPKDITGDKAEKILEDVGIACNKNAIPYDPNPPKITSGLRFGTAAATSRGFNENDFRQIGDIISEVLDNINKDEDNQIEFISSMKNKVISMCKKYPIYNEAY